MFEKIIVASEMMKGEQQLIQSLGELRSIGVRQCLLLQCLDESEVYAQISSYVQEIYDNMLTRHKEQLEEKGFVVETRILSGDMKKEILRIAEEEDFDLVVAASPALSMTAELFYGGVAHDVIYRSGKPVLLIRIFEDAEGFQRAENKAGALTDHVLFPTDFSENAGLAFEVLREMVAAGVKRVTLAHVQDPSAISPYLADRLDEFNEKDTLRLNELKDELLQTGDVSVEIKLLDGSPSAELIRLIREQQIPLVVMGSQGRGFVRDLFLGSVSHNIARHSAASVILIPAPRDTKSRSR